MCHPLIWKNAQSLLSRIAVLSAKVEILRADGYLELGPALRSGLETVEKRPAQSPANTATGFDTQDQMKIAALSDFHIGSTSRGDCFRHTEASFHNYLDELEEIHDSIVLLGDIFQAEHGPSMSKAGKRDELRRAQQYMPDLWTRMQGPRYHYLHGNHDSVAASENQALASLRLEDHGFSIFFVHGHTFDPLLRRFYPLAQASTWFSGRLRNHGLSPVADWLEHKDIRIKHAAFKGEGGPYVAAARELLKEHRVDAVVMGHTHVPQRLDLAEGIFANTGTCSMGQRMHLSIDTSTGQVEHAQS